jgi:hypothetical protein
MDDTLVLTECSCHGLALVKVRLRDRMAVRLRARALDAGLAAGTRPEASAQLAVRAIAITRSAFRGCLADALERLLIHAARPAGLRPTPLTSARRQVVLAATDQLDALIRRLRAGDPVAARGVAEVIMLISDGTGPLQAGTSEPDLPSAISTALGHLDEPIVVGTSPGCPT